MIRVLQVNKVGNRIRGYVCTDGRVTYTLNKSQLIGYIKAGQVANATIQVYNGGTIVRIKDSMVTVKTITKEAERAALNRTMAMNTMM